MQIHMYAVWQDTADGLEAIGLFGTLLEAETAVGNAIAAAKADRDQFARTDRSEGVIRTYALRGYSGWRLFIAELA